MSEPVAPLPEGILATDPDLAPGTVVGEYRIEGKLGEGGFGTVYKAVHPLIGKAAAIKVLHRQFSANANMVERFVAEARAVNQIRHRGIIDIFAFGSLGDGRQYYVMELLDGSTLDALLERRGRLTIDEALPILRGIARALDAAHAAGIAHRDLKPENVFLTTDDEGRPLPKLLDFGIAKLLDPGSTPRTQTGTPMGTPQYMSPEQARGVGVDHRTDVYSFGVMTFQMLTGRMPFAGEAVMDILLKQITEAPPRASEACADVPASLDAPILHMLAKEAGGRPETVTAAVDELTVAAGKPVPHGTPSTADLAQSLHDLPGVAKKRSGIETARTIAQPAGPTFVGSTSEVGVAPPRKRKLWIVGAVALAALAIGGAATLAWRTSATAIGKDRAATAPAKSVLSGPDQTPGFLRPGPGPVAPGRPSTSNVPALAPLLPDVILTFRGVPDGTELWLGEAKVGTTPDAARVPRNAGTVTLTLKARGYKPKAVEVSAAQDMTMLVTLEKATGAPTGTDVHPTDPALENPF